MKAERRSNLWQMGFIMTLMTIFLLTLYHFWHSDNPEAEGSASRAPSSDLASLFTGSKEDITKPVYADWDPRAAVRGKPTPKFRDNLLNETKYITTWSQDDGFMKDQIAFLNMIYVGTEADRVPIVAPFVPSSVDGMSSFSANLPFGEVFDLRRLSKKLNKPILDWKDVKDLSVPDKTESETIGCWSLWLATHWGDNRLKPANIIHKYLGLDVSHEQAPHTVNLYQVNHDDYFATYWSMIALSFPIYRARWLREDTREAPIAKIKLKPDQHLLCFDHTYYTTSYLPFELADGRHYSPAWKHVGMNMHFTPRLMDIADQYVREVFAVLPGKPTPKYIAVHAVREDIDDHCRNKETKADCFPVKDAYGRRVQEVRNEIERTTKNNDVPVIITSSTKDEKFWQEMKNFGYWRLNHDDTIANYGEWYRSLIDQAVQANAIGFVGADASIESSLAKLRVEAWQKNAVTRIIKWGYKDADAH